MPQHRWQDQIVDPMDSGHSAVPADGDGFNSRADLAKERYPPGSRLSKTYGYHASPAPALEIHLGRERREIAFLPDSIRSVAKCSGYKAPLSRRRNIRIPTTRTSYVLRAPLEP